MSPVVRWMSRRFPLFQNDEEMPSDVSSLWTAPLVMRRADNRVSVPTQGQLAQVTNGRTSPGMTPCRIPSISVHLAGFVSVERLVFVGVKFLLALHKCEKISTSLIRILAYVEFALHRLTWNAVT